MQDAGMAGELHGAFMQGICRNSNRRRASIGSFLEAVGTHRGTLNGLFLREKLIDYVDLVVAPILVGGKDTSTLIDGKSILSEGELSKLGPLKLRECVVLENSYLRLCYEVIH